MPDSLNKRSMMAQDRLSDPREIEIGRESERYMIEQAELDALDRRRMRKPMAREEQIPWQSILVESKKA